MTCGNPPKSGSHTGTCNPHTLTLDQEKRVEGDSEVGSAWFPSSPGPCGWPPDSRSGLGPPRPPQPGPAPLVYPCSPAECWLSDASRMEAAISHTMLDSRASWLPHTQAEPSQLKSLTLS